MASKLTTTAAGRTAEGLAASYLAEHGFHILSRNWRNRWCELDLVARRSIGADAQAHTEIHFIEVKYRRNIAFGYAAEYISRDKSARLIRAALAWNQAHHYEGPYQISVIAVEGDLQHPTITFLPGAVSD